MSFRIYAKKSTTQFMLPATILFITGIWWCARYQETTLPIVIALATISATIYTQKNNKTKILSTILLCCCFLFGVKLYSFEQKKQLDTQKAICETYCSIRGKIVSLEKSKQPFMNKIVTIALKEFKPSGQWWRKEKATVQIYTRKINDLHVADSIEVWSLFFKKPPNKSFNEYLTKNGIAATAFAEQLKYKILHRPYLSLTRWISKQKKNLYENLKRKISPNSFSLFSSIFFGNKTEKKYCLEKSKAQFKNWGILHFLARSGLHLIIFILLWSFFLKQIPISFFSKQLILIFLALLYCCMSWTSISFIRALSIFLLYKISPFLNARANGIHLLLVVCLLTLALSPISLLFLDFQLSFGLTFALAWFGRSLLQKTPELKKC